MSQTKRARKEVAVILPVPDQATGGMRYRVEVLGSLPLGRECPGHGWTVLRSEQFGWADTTAMAYCGATGK
jgi:hypothetical protein